MNNRIFRVLVVTCGALFSICGVGSCIGGPFSYSSLRDGLEDLLANAESVSEFDGGWFELEHQFALEITGRIGVLSVANSEERQVGDEVLIIIAVDDNGFTGRWVFMDGTSYDVTGQWVDENTLNMSGAGWEWVLVRLEFPNTAPTADAGDDRNVVAGLVVSLDGSGSSDPDVEDTLSYAWQQTAGTEVQINNATSSQATFTVPNDADSLAFMLTVNDDEGEADTATLTLTVVSSPRVRLTTTLGDVVMEILLTEAPVTSLNFLQYVEDGFYDGTIFHRVVRDFVVQGGGNLPGLVLQQGLRDPITNEFSADRSNIRGTVAMAKISDDPDSATSQFFFNLVNNSENLDSQNGGFTVFARVLEGMEVVDSMAQVETSTQQKPDGTTMADVPVDDITLTSAILE